MQVSDWLTRVLDYPLGFLLVVPRDIAIAIVAVATSLLLTFARKWTTDQDRLRRAKGDLKRLKQLRRQARRAKDKDTVASIRATVGMIQVIRMKAEGMPLLVALVPIALLGIWCFGRLDYHPARVNEDLTIAAYYPLSSVGKLTHLVPPDGVEMRSDPIQAVGLDPQGEINGLATWEIRPTVASDAITLVVRHEGQTAEHVLSVGGRTYAPPLELPEADKIEATEVRLRQYKLLGILPGIPAILLAPWLVAYLVIAIICVPVVRKVFKIY